MNFSNLQDYSQFVYSLPETYASIQHLTLVLAPMGATLARLEGQIVFQDAVILDVWELLDWENRRILNYSYEVYRAGEKILWYDPFEHPSMPELAVTFPHHKHISPNIKHNRVPAPGIGFDHPNLPYLIQEIERDILKR